MTHGNIPQNRERIFIAGFLDKEKRDVFEFPKEIPLTKSFKDFMIKEVDEKYFYNDKPLFGRIKDDVNSEDTVYQWRRKYVRANKKGVVPTLTANMGLGGHNVPIIKNGKGIRKLTPKECFMLQGFPKNFKLPDLADTKLYHQAGNSVTVAVIERIAKEMKKVLKA
jgi:DNA (cytosine-5)-methyltransferase 1